MGSLQAKQAATDDHGGASTGCCGQHLVDIIQIPERYHAGKVLARNGNDEGIGNRRQQQLIVADSLTRTGGGGLSEVVNRCPGSEERSEGKECVSTCGSRWTTNNEKKKK